MSNSLSGRRTGIRNTLIPTMGFSFVLLGLSLAAVGFGLVPMLFQTYQELLFVKVVRVLTVIGILVCVKLAVSAFYYDRVWAAKVREFLFSLGAKNEPIAKSPNFTQVDSICSYLADNATQAFVRLES